MDRAVSVPGMNDRTCIVSRKSGPAETMIRFVADPQGVIVADLRGQLPGRGCWVTAERAFVQQAADRNLFARALKSKVSVPADLVSGIDALLVSALTGMMSLARKAGQLVVGSTKADAAVRSGQAIAVLHATDAAPDGIRKMDQARHALAEAGGGQIAAFQLLPADDMAVLSAGGQVIHVAVLAGQAGEGVVKRAKMLDRFRNGVENGLRAGEPAKETETE